MSLLKWLLVVSRSSWAKRLHQVHSKSLIYGQNVASSCVKTSPKVWSGSSVCHLSHLVSLAPAWKQMQFKKALRFRVCTYWTCELKSFINRTRPMKTRQALSARAKALQHFYDKKKNVGGKARQRRASSIRWSGSLFSWIISKDGPLWSVYDWRTDVCVGVYESQVRRVRRYEMNTWQPLLFNILKKCHWRVIYKVSVCVHVCMCLLKAPTQRAMLFIADWCWIQWWIIKAITGSL